MRKKFVKSDRPTYKRRITKAQEGIKFAKYTAIETPQVDYSISNPTNPFSEYNVPTVYNTEKALIVPEVAAEPTEEVINNEPIQEVTKPTKNKVTKFTGSKDFINKMRPIFTAALSKRGLDPKYADYLVAQSALESGWGKSQSGKFNLGGIKGKGSVKKTREVINGKDVYINDSFRDFNSLEDYADYHVGLLNNNRYKAFNTDDFIGSVVKGGYATDPKYRTALSKMYKQVVSARYGGIIKYRDGGVAKRDATYVAPKSNNPYNPDPSPSSEIVTTPPRWTVQNGKLVKQPAKQNARVIPLETVSPEFDILTGIRGLFSSKGKVSSSVATNKYPPHNPNINVNSDGTWNISKILKDVKDGTKDAVDFLGSDIKKQADANNLVQARRLGFKNFQPYKDAANRAGVEVTPDYTTISYPSSSNLGEVYLDKTMRPERDILRYNTYSDTRPTAFHETLHRGMYGRSTNGPLAGESFDSHIRRHADNTDFYKLKSEKLLIPRSKAKDIDSYNYLMMDGEAAANVMEVGKRMGLKSGQAYPGRVELEKMIKEFSQSGNEKGFVVDYLNMKRPSRVWDALTGKYFTHPLLIGTAGGINYGKTND